MTPLSSEALAQLFKEARTAKKWTHQEVQPSLLMDVYNLVKFGPTSGNCQPGRFTFLTQTVSKEKLRPSLSAGNIEIVLSAPVVVIVSHDPMFYEALPRLYPEVELRSWYAGDIPFSEETAFRNSTLQGGYLILAARALGLDVAPISGFDNVMVDSLFFEERGWQSNFLICLGYAQKQELSERLSRLEFDEACLML